MQGVSYVYFSTPTTDGPSPSRTWHESRVGETFDVSTSWSAISQMTSSALLEASQAVVQSITDSTHALSHSLVAERELGRLKTQQVAIPTHRLTASRSLTSRCLFALLPWSPLAWLSMACISSDGGQTIPRLLHCHRDRKCSHPQLGWRREAPVATLGRLISS